MSLRTRITARTAGPAPRRRGAAVLAAVALLPLGVPAAQATADQATAGQAAAGQATGRQSMSAATPERASATVPELNWIDCEEGFQCATAQVPLDYDEPDGTSIELALIRLPARQQDNRIGSLFTNPGGPGGSGVQFVRGAAKSIYTPAVRNRFDIIGFDPRGVGASTPVRCFETAAEQAEFFTDPDTFPVGDEQVDRAIGKARELAQRCEQRAGELLEHTSTANVARDMDLLRQAVGDEQLSYAGYSYGTFLGATYANLFPSKVRALVLDGVVDAQAYAGGPRPAATFIRQNSHLGSDETLDEWFRLCEEAASRCAFTDGGEPRQKFAELAERLAAQPFTFPEELGGIQFGYDELIAVVVNVSYVPVLWGLLGEGLELLYDATGPVQTQQAVAGLQALADRDAAGNDDEPPYDNFREGQLANLCVDSRNPRNANAFRREAALADQQAPYVGSYWTYASLPCAFWGRQDRDRYRGPWNARTSAPALLLNPTFDPATPLRNARTMRDLLPGSRLVEVHGWGHTAAQTGSACADGIAERYLINGTLPPASATCLTGIVPFTGAGNFLEALAVSDAAPRIWDGR